jgi:hypothetical protein
MQWMKFDDGSVKVLLECKERGRIARFVETTDYLEAEVERVVETTPDSTGAIEGLARSAAARFTQYVRANEQISPEAVHVVTHVKDASELADLVASHLAIEIPSRQELLETTSVLGRLQAILSFMGNDLHVPQRQKEIRVLRAGLTPVQIRDCANCTSHSTQPAITHHRRTWPIPAGTRSRRPYAVWTNSNGLLSGCCLEKVQIGERWRRKAT